MLAVSGGEGRVPRVSICSALAALLALQAMPVSATVYSPWILSEHVADMRDEARFAADSRWAELAGQERALAVWRYLTDRDTGTWHFSDMWEGGDPYWESKLVKDPTKILNVYGFGVCTMHACLIEGIYEAMGYGVRQQEFGGYHRTAEVEWDGAWHYLDVDERAYLIDQDGRVVSVTEAVETPELWERSARLVSPFYPQNGGIKGIEELAKHGPAETHWHWRALGHSMDFSLRPGESLTRYWRGQGRWRMSGAWQNEETLKILREDPAGPKTSSRASINNSYGNGEWVYEPKLSLEYDDFEEGVYRKCSVKLDPEGIALTSPGPGWVEWRVRTPYIIVGDSNDLADPDDDEGAAVVEFSAEGKVDLSISTDQGCYWERVWSSSHATGRHTVDLTRWVAGRYEYHVRFDLRGNPDTTRLRAVKITTWTQLAPMSLPRLKKGMNRMKFVWGDRHGWATEVMAVEPELSDACDMERWDIEVGGNYDPDDRTMRVRGPLTLHLTALKGTKIRWLHIGGAFNARRENGDHTPDRILYSLEPSRGWDLVRQETPPKWNQHWYYNLEADLILDRPAETLWLRLDPATAVNGLRAWAHCAPDDVHQEGPVMVTHTFQADGEPKTETFRFTEPRDYQVRCDGEPENMSVGISVPSRRRSVVSQGQ